MGFRHTEKYIHFIHVYICVFFCNPLWFHRPPSVSMDLEETLNKADRATELNKRGYTRTKVFFTNLKVGMM